MVERFQIYQLTVPVVPPGGIKGVPLQLDTDAPFALRLVKSRNIGANGWNFQTPRKQWQSSGLRTDWNIPAGGGAATPSRGAPIYPQMVYPVGGQIVCDIGNDTDENLVDARILFRGTKLYGDGALSAPTYPARFDTTPFSYQRILNIGLADAAGNPATGSIIFTVKETSDFVFRYGTCDPYTAVTEGGVIGGDFQLDGGLILRQPNFTEVYVTLRDEAKKGYSNEPIHVNDLFGQSNPQTSDDQGVGPMFPGLIIPEIYVPSNRSLYLDVLRYDASGVAVDLNFALQGAKVFSR